MDGYDILDKPLKIRSADELYEYVQLNYGDAQGRDTNYADSALRAVVNVLNRRMGSGEMQKVAANMPEKIRRLFEEAGKAGAVVFALS